MKFQSFVQYLCLVFLIMVWVPYEIGTMFKKYQPTIEVRYVSECVEAGIFNQTSNTKEEGEK